MTTSIALSITHAPWIPARIAPMSRIVAALAWEGPEAADAGFKYVHTESTPGPNWKWGEAQWSWALSTGAGGAIFLQDDTLVPGVPREHVETPPPRGTFWRYFRAMMLAIGDDTLIGFHTRHPEAQTLALLGRHWISTTELVGTGYYFPRALLLEFMAWREKMGLERVRKIDEDTSIGAWARETKRRIWHPIPTIIDHDTDLASTAGNDRMDERRPAVFWDDEGWSDEQLASPGFWRAGIKDAPHYITHYAPLTTRTT